MFEAVCFVLVFRAFINFSSSSPAFVNLFVRFSAADLSPSRLARVRLVT